MEQLTTSTARRNTATLIGLAIVAVALFGSSDVSRSTSMRHFLNERYSAENVIGENTVARNATYGRGTGGRRPVMRKVLGAGEAAVQSLNEFRSSADCQSQMRQHAMRAFLAS